MTKRTALLIFGLIIATLVYLVINTLVFEKEAKKTLPETPSPTTSSFPMTLSIFPNTLSIQPNVQTSVDIVLDTQAIPPSIIQLEIAYDPRVLTDMTIAPGNFAPNQTVTLQNINHQTGRISYAAQIPDQKLPSTKGGVAKLIFNARPETKVSQTAIYFLPKTAIQTKGGTNGLSAAYGGTILVMPGESNSTNALNGFSQQ